jgi:hypothetical protein
MRSSVCLLYLGGLPDRGASCRPLMRCWAEPARSHDSNVARSSDAAWIGVACLATPPIYYDGFLPTGQECPSRSPGRPHGYRRFPNRRPLRAIPLAEARRRATPAVRAAPTRARPPSRPMTRPAGIVSDSLSTTSCLATPPNASAILIESSGGAIPPSQRASQRNVTTSPRHARPQRPSLTPVSSCGRKRLIPCAADCHP